MNGVETGSPLKHAPPLRLCPRIIVLRTFVHLIPKLDVAGSTPVARSRRNPVEDRVVTIIALIQVMAFQWRVGRGWNLFDVPGPSTRGPEIPTSH